VSLVLGSSLEKGSKTMDTFEWLPTESAPKHYPVQVVAGNLYFADGSSIYIPDRKVVKNGWGYIGSTHIVGDELKPVPTRLDIHWFSFTEDVFYSGVFELPTESMLDLFHEGLKSPTNGEDITYDRIIVGMAPGGEVSVWLGAEAVALEVANFVAEEAATEWSAILDNPDVPRQEYIDIVMEESVDAEQRANLLQHGVPKGLWGTYRQQYAWQPAIEGAEPVVMWLRTLNGENEFLNFEAVASERLLRAIPKAISLTWKNMSGQRYKSEIEFDEGEIVAVYRKMTGDKSDRQLELHIEISQVPPTVDVAITESNYVLPLKKFKVKTYKAR
jgi:hypothetical protein